MFRARRRRSERPGASCDARRSSMSTEQKQPMTPSDASRIQAHADKTGRNQDFKRRAQGAAAKKQSGRAGGKGSAGRRKK